MDLATDRFVPRVLLSRRNDLQSLPVSADGAVVALEEPGRSFVLRNVVENKDVGHTAAINHNCRLVAPSSDGRLLAIATDSQTALLWDCQDGREIARFPLHRDDPREFRFSADNRYLAF